MTSAPRTSTPASYKPMRMPSSQATPATPPPPRISARVLFSFDFIKALLTHFNDSTPSDSAFENGSQSLRKILQRRFVPNEIEKMLRLVIAGQAFPDLAAYLHRAVFRLNTQQ